MSRLKLGLPERVFFSTEIPVRVSDLNYDNHMGNDSFLSIAHEARMQFFRHFGYTELNVEGRRIIMSDAAVVYRSEAFYGDVLRVDIGVGDFTETACDITYAFWNARTGKEVARLKTGIVFLDQETRKPVPMPSEFRNLFVPSSSPPPDVA